MTENDSHLIDLFKKAMDFYQKLLPTNQSDAYFSIIMEHYGKTSNKELAKHILEQETLECNVYYKNSLNIKEFTEQIKEQFNLDFKANCLNNMPNHFVQFMFFRKSDLFSNSFGIHVLFEKIILYSIINMVRVHLFHLEDLFLNLNNPYYEIYGSFSDETLFYIDVFETDKHTFSVEISDISEIYSYDVHFDYSNFNEDAIIQTITQIQKLCQDKILNDLKQILTK